MPGPPLHPQGLAVISNELVEILVCPEDRTPVRRAEQDLIDRLNEQIRAGELKTRSRMTTFTIT